MTKLATPHAPAVRGTGTNWKQETRKQWNGTACGQVPGDGKSLDYFLDVERSRYEDAPWMPGCFEYSKYGGKKLLEIGFGQGTDLSQFAQAGAECHGVDITENHFQRAQRNLACRGLAADLRLHDACDLPFADETFDVVYSFGVLHHTPDTQRCLDEARRVLKPGGELLLALYHWRSYNHLKLVLKGGLLQGKLFRVGYDGLLSTIEEGADGKHIKPLVKLYTAGQVRRMLGEFSSVRTEIQHLTRQHIRGLGKLLPAAVMRALAARFGHYVVAKAVK